MHELLDAFREERQLHRRFEGDSTSSDAYARQVRKIERDAIRERNMWSIRRKLRAGEVKRIVELRFGEVGGMVAIGMSYTAIAKKLYLRRATVISVCYAYVRRGGTIRGPGEHWSKGKRKLTDT